MVMQFREQILRSNFYWNDIDEDLVKRNIETLQKWKKQVDDARMIFSCLSSRFTAERKEALDQEIKLCKFYLEYLERKQEPGFGVWQFYLNKDRDDVHEWQKEKAGDCYTKTNGKIRATVNLYDNGKTTKVSLEISNDSSILDFFYHPSYCEIEYKHLKNKDSIKEYIEELKEKAEQIFQEYQFPRWDDTVNNYRALCQLVHAEEE